MDSIDYLHKQIQSMVNLQDSALGDLTDAQLGFLPGGTVSPIGVIWLHMAYSEDKFISILMGKSPVWDSGGWKERFQLENAPGFGEDWSAYHEKGMTVDLLKDYTEAVRAETKVCLKSTKPHTLDDTVKFFTDSDSKADVWVLLVGHTVMHAGEVAALKGVQGVKGLPF